SAALYPSGAARSSRTPRLGRAVHLSGCGDWVRRAAASRGKMAKWRKAAALLRACAPSSRCTTALRVAASTCQDGPPLGVGAAALTQSLSVCRPQIGNSPVPTACAACSSTAAVWSRKRPARPAQDAEAGGGAGVPGGPARRREWLLPPARVLELAEPVEHP